MISAICLVISIHAPHTGRDYISMLLTLGSCHFNPRAPYGARPVVFGNDQMTSITFQSTRPIRGATASTALVIIWPVFQSTRPIRGATVVHAVVAAAIAISIHAPHTGRDSGSCWRYSRRGLFQSTRPIRGATLQEGRAADAGRISIHAPHTGRDARRPTWTPRWS